MVICPDRLGTNETKTQKERRPLSASDSAHGAVARGARPPAALRCPAPVMENAHTSVCYGCCECSTRAWRAERTALAKSAVRAMATYPPTLVSKVYICSPAAPQCPTLCLLVCIRGLYCTALYCATADRHESLLPNRARDSSRPSTSLQLHAATTMSLPSGDSRHSRQRQRRPLWIAARPAPVAVP